MENNVGQANRIARVHWRAELLGGMIAHRLENAVIRRAEKALERALRNVYLLDGSTAHADCAADAASITEWHSKHLQDAMADKGIDLEPCRVCEINKYDRRLRDSITESMRHTEEELEYLTRV